MQISAYPDLAHTRPTPTPMHWLATATAMAAALAISGFVQPLGGTAGQSVARADSPRRAPAQHVAAPDPKSVTYPLDCGPVGITVTNTATGDLDGDGIPETVAAVRCNAGSGTAPSGIYVLNRTRTTAPRIVATLVAPSAKESVGKEFAIKDGTLTATLLGYSSPNVPSCCPDVKRQVSWAWRDGMFVRSEHGGAKSI